MFHILDVMAQCSGFQVLIPYVIIIPRSAQVLWNYSRLVIMILIRDCGAFKTRLYNSFELGCFVSLVVVMMMMNCVRGVSHIGNPNTFRIKSILENLSTVSFCWAGFYGQNCFVH